MAQYYPSRIATYVIEYSTGDTWERGPDQVVYCSAKYKNLAQWRYDISALQNERLGRKIIISRVYAYWHTSARYTYDIYVQGNRAYGRSWGWWLCSATGTSATEMQQIGGSAGIGNAAVSGLQDLINSGATEVYMTCQNTENKTGYGSCQYGIMLIEYEYATPLNVINDCASDKSQIVLGEQVGVTATINNTTLEPVTGVRLEIVRESDGVETVVGNAVDLAVDIPVGGQTGVSASFITTAWNSPQRSTQLKLRATIAGAEPESVNLCTALDKRYAPSIEAFRVYRAINDPLRGWTHANNGIHTMTNLKIALADGDNASGFTLKAYYSTGVVDMATSPSIDLTASIASAKEGIADGLNIVDIAGGFALDDAWNVAVILTDTYETARMDAYIGRAFTNLHLAGLETGGVRIGGYCRRSTKDHPAFECDYPMYADGGMIELYVPPASGEVTAKAIHSTVIRSKSEEPFHGTSIIFDPISGADKIVSVRGYFDNASGRFILPYAQGAYWAHATSTGNIVHLNLSDNFNITDVLLVVEYTKATGE